MAGKRWTEEEVEYLKENYGTVSAREIAETLGRGLPGLHSKAATLGLDGRVGHWSHAKRVGAWTKEEIEFLKANYLTLGAEACARQLGRTKAAVHGKIRKVGGGRPSIGPKVEWTEDELSFLRENYQIMSWEEMAQKLGRTEQAIQVRASMLGMQRYRDPYEFFETWTEESAYTIGFFAADGWVSKRGPESIRISFSQKDADILYAIKAEIGSGNVYAKQNGMHRYYIQSVRAYERLCDIFGHDVCNKTHTLRWPSVPDEYIRHFLRGAVDGDGSLFKRTDGLWEFTYTTSSQDFIDSLVEHIERCTGICMKPGLNKLKVWHARAAGVKAVCLADWLYRDATIALERKAALAQQMMEHRGTVYNWLLTPKMRRTFPHILERYEIVERVAQ
jgi:hypothetical protein